MGPNKSNISESKLDYVDVMRAFAILMVITRHTAESFHGLSAIVDGLARFGQMGVQLFFVTSAYTLCLSYERRTAEINAVLNFYIRRFFRIAPIYYFAIAMYFFAHVLGQIVAEKEITLDPYSSQNVMANILFVHGFVPAANNNIVLGGWSIGTEMAFYAIFPIIFMFIKWQYKRGGFLRLWILLIVYIIAILVLNSIVFKFTGLKVQNNNFLYFNLLNQLPVFVIGMIAFLSHQNQTISNKSSIWGQLAGFLVFASLSMFLCRLHIDIGFVIIPTISAISFLFLVSILRAKPKYSLILRRIGQVSYSMYIFHFLFAWFLLKAILDRTNFVFLSPDLLFPGALVAVIALTFVVAQASEKIIESRGIALGRLIISRMVAPVQTAERQPDQTGQALLSFNQDKSHSRDVEAVKTEIPAVLP